jgi:hypothetical protein
VYAGVRMRINIIWQSLIQIRIRVESWIRIRIKVKFRAVEAPIGPKEGRGRSQWRRGGKKWSREGVYSPVVTDSYHLMRSRIRIHIKVKRPIRICMKVMRIRNLGFLVGEKIGKKLILR